MLRDIKSYKREYIICDISNTVESRNMISKLAFKYNIIKWERSNDIMLLVDTNIIIADPSSLSKYLISINSYIVTTDINCSVCRSLLYGVDNIQRGVLRRNV